MSVTERWESAETELLYQAVQELSSTMDPDRILESLLGRTVEAIRCEAGSVFLLRPQADELDFKIVFGERAETIRRANLRLRLGEGIAGTVAQTGQPIRANDAAAHPKFNSQVDWLTGYRTRSILCVPMKARGRILGVIEAINKKPEAASFTDRDEALLSALAGHAAVAYEHAAVMRDLQAARRYLEAVVENMPGGFIATDPRGRIQAFNPRASEILDLPGGRLIGESYETALAGRPLLKEAIAAALRDGRTALRQEGRMETPRPMRLGYSTMVIHDRSGEIRGAAVIFQELS